MQALKNKNFLIIDNDLFSFHSLLSQLNSANIKATGNNGNGSLLEVVSIAEQIRPDIIISDMNFPNFFGKELFFKLKSNPFMSHACLVSYLLDRGHNAEATNNGADFVFLKNEINPLALLAKLDKIWENKKRIT